MNRIIYTAAYIGKKALKAGKFYYKNIETKLKSNTVEMTNETNMSYDDAVRVLNKLHPKREIDFTKPCIRAKEISCDVSIIVPVYNAEKNLETCIASLIHQKTKFTYEIICVNDGSSDDSLKLLHKLSLCNDKLIIVDQKNGGASAARNSGIEIAQGRYFFFVDADDILPEESIDLLMKTALKSDADIVQGNIAKCNENGEIYYINMYKKGVLDNALEYYNCNMSGTTWGRLYKRELWDRIDFFAGYAYEDAIVWCNVYPECKKMVYKPELIYIFRSQNNSLFKRQNNSEKCLDAIWIIEQCVQLHKNMRIEESNEWYQIVLWQLSVGIITRIRYISNDEVLQAAFIIAKNVAESLQGYRKTAFEGKNKTIYIQIENSFEKMQYKKWIEYSYLLSCSTKV